MPGDITFHDSILALHIVAVVAAFGVLFAYPIVFGVLTRQDPRALPGVHRAALALNRRLINPGLLVVVLAGIYLASDKHAWKVFYVQWGVGVALVLGGLFGAFLAPREKRLIDLAQRDVDAAAGAPVTMSPEYRALVGQVTRVVGVSSLLVLVTVFIMANHVGAGS